MERGGNNQQQNVQSQQPYPSQGMPMGNQQYGGYQPQRVSSANNYATWSLWLGIFSMLGQVCCCGFGGFIGAVGAIFGIAAVRDKQCSKMVNASVGLVLSVISIIITALLLLGVYASELERKLSDEGTVVEIEESSETIEENIKLTEEVSSITVNLDEITYSSDNNTEDEDKTLSYRIGACLSEAMSLYLQGIMNSDDYEYYKETVTSLEYNILNCIADGKSDQIYEQDVIDAENYIYNYKEEVFNQTYAFTLDFSNKNQLQCNCSDTATDIKVWEHKVYDIYSEWQDTEYYIQLPNGEYEIEYVGGENYLMDPVGHIRSNTWDGYSQKTCKLVEKGKYTIENVPDDSSSMWYEPDDFVVINRTTEGEGRITIANGDKLIIEDNTKQLLVPFFDKNGNGLIKLYKIKDN